MSNNKAVILSILLSMANITGSSGLTIWIDNTLKKGGPILSAYASVFSYLMGLSIGCMMISFFVRRTKNIFLKENIFLYSLQLATINCLIFSKEWVTIPVWVDAIHRIIWGIMSGFTIILGRNILISEEDEKRTNHSFSILSLALLCLPFLIPIIFYLCDLNNRTSSTFFASIIYTISLVVYLAKNKKNIIKRNDISTAVSLRKSSNITVLSFLNLVIINVYFFLLLMIMPAMRVMYFNYLGVAEMYITLLTIWLPCAIFIINIIKRFELVKKIIIGNIMQLISLFLCFISLHLGSGMLYVLFILFIFLVNIIMQPIFFSYLGLHSKNPVYTFGMQSGIYVFITTIILVYTIFININMEQVTIAFTSLLILSVINSIIFTLTVNRIKDNMA